MCVDLGVLTLRIFYQFATTCGTGNFVCVDLGAQTLRIFYQFATTVQKRLKDLVPEIMHVRAFKFAVSQEFYIAVQLKFTLYMCIYIVDKS